MTVETATSLGSMIGVIIMSVMNKIYQRKATKVRNEIHSAVNGRTTIMLRKYAILAGRFAALTNNQTDKDVASEAELAYQVQLKQMKKKHK